MYVEPNFQTKKALKEAVAAWVEHQDRLKARERSLTITVGDILASKTPEPKPVYVFSPGPFPAEKNGETSVEGPHYPKPHSWYARVRVENGIVVKVLG